MDESIDNNSAAEIQDWFLLDALGSDDTPGYGEVLADAQVVDPQAADPQDIEPEHLNAPAAPHDLTLTTYRPPTKPGKVNPWDPRLIIDLNLAVDTETEILERYGITNKQLGLLMKNPIFRQDLAVTSREMREQGIPFARKAAVQAEAYLEVLDEIVTDPRTPASTKLACISKVVKWGNLEPKEDKGNSAAGGAVINVQINF